MEECCLLCKLIWYVLKESYFCLSFCQKISEKINISEISSWLFILNYIYGKPSMFFISWPIKCSMTWWIPLGFLFLLLSFHLSCSLLPLHDFEKVRTHKSLQNISNHFIRMKQVWIVGVCWVKNVKIFMLIF